ncbi:MAG: hypothetical protein HWN79_11935 [Candidatus Lokiarchaeota archaeon]|nr:hypothetical protein [Candidatus Lokiarchaeota archaeon]
MVKSYFTLFLKFELRRILSYFILLILIIFFLESSQVALESPLYLYLGLLVSISGFMLIYLWIKAKKIFIILDTKLKQEQFKEEKGINPLEGIRFKTKYNYWLLKNAENGMISSIYKNFFSYNSKNYCLYCYLSIIPIILVWVFSNIYMTPTESLVTSVIFVGCLILLCIALEKREIGTYYKVLDSEIKQILFEEVTGYDPLDNGKMTYKYKAWLILEA